ncbi:hypothetical protein [Flavobacterium sp.]
MEQEVIGKNISMLMPSLQVC